MDYFYVKCKTALSKSLLPGLDYSLNPYFGCEHGCLYCYVPSVFRSEELASNWGKFVRAKMNILEVLKKELMKSPKGVIGVSTVTDPYQPLEKKLQLTRECLKLLSKHRLTVSIQTKSMLVLRDLDVLNPSNFDVGITITTMEDWLAKEIEPEAPSPSCRAKTLEELSQKNIPTWIFFGPIIPRINDREENIEKIVMLAKRTNSELLYDRLNLKSFVMRRLEPFLERESPELIEELPKLLASNSGYFKRIERLIEKACKKYGVKFGFAFFRR
ncbi:MAG: radical SAM protein [Candidatus Bathyarchaeia archaeon]